MTLIEKYNLKPFEITSVETDSAITFGTVIIKSKMDCEKNTIVYDEIPMVLTGPSANKAEILHSFKKSIFLLINYTEIESLREAKIFSFDKDLTELQMVGRLTNIIDEKIW